MTPDDESELVKAVAKAICTARGPEPQCLWHEWQVEASAAIAVVLDAYEEFCLHTGDGYQQLDAFRRALNPKER